MSEASALRKSVLPRAAAAPSNEPSAVSARGSRAGNSGGRPACPRRCLDRCPSCSTIRYARRRDIARDRSTAGRRRSLRCRASGSLQRTRSSTEPTRIPSRCAGARHQELLTGSLRVSRYRCGRRGFKVVQQRDAMSWKSASVFWRRNKARTCRAGNGTHESSLVLRRGKFGVTRCYIP